MSQMVDVASVVVEGRHRKDMGDLKSLADSMVAIGQLQEIGIDKDSRLIFGERRLRAAELAGWAMIRAKIVNLADILRAEHDENEIRKDFTAMERVAIGKAIKAALGDRQGQRTDQLGGPGHQVGDRGPRTDELAAKAAGFGSGDSFARAEKVLDHGAPELQDAVDAGDIGLKEGAEIAKAVPKGEQAEVVSMDRERRKRETAERKKSKVVIDPYTPEQRKNLERTADMAWALFSCAEKLAKTGKAPGELAWEFLHHYPHDVPHMAEWLESIERDLFPFVRELDNMKEKDDAVTG